MSGTITAVRAVDFLSFGAMDLPLDGSGVVFVRGSNRDAAGSSSNGAGKSSLLDAVLWCLYGQTLRGAETEEVIRRGATEAVVEVDLERGGESYTVRRTRTVGGKSALRILIRGRDTAPARLADAQERVDALVGLSREAFTASVAFGQGVTRFARMTDRERKSLLETMLGFDAFARALDVTRAKLAQARSELALVESDLTRVETAKADYEAEVKRVRAEIGAWEGKEKARLYEVRKKLSAARKRLEKLESVREETSDEGLAESEATVKALRTEEAGLLRFDDPRPALEQRLRALEKTTTEIGRKGPCPTCGAGLTPEQRAKIQQDFQSEAEAIGSKIDEAAKADEDRKTRLRKLRERLGREEARLQSLREARQKANARKAEIGAVQREIVALEGSIEAGSEAPLADVLERAESKLRLVTEKQAALESLLPAQHQTVKRLEFWEAGFGLRGLRSMALDEVLPRFEALAGAYLERLTGSALGVRLSAISNLKGGGSKDALAVEVENSAGAGTYRGQSAGERARVDLALALALFDLTRERVGGVGFVFFDEAFEALDDAGCEAVARLLARESKRWGRVFVVSHLDTLAGYFQETLEVVKEGGVSRIEGSVPARRKIATATVK